MDILSSVRPDTPLGLAIMAIMVASFLFAPLALFLLGTYSFSLVISIGMVKTAELLFGNARQAA